MEITEFHLRKRPTYETGSETRPYEASIVLKDGGSSYKPDIKLNLTDEFIEPILKIVMAAATDAFTDAADDFRERVLAALKGPPVEAKALEAPEQED